jgi:MoaD family protein
MSITIHFYSYFADLIGDREIAEEMPAGSTIGDLLQRLLPRFPALAAMQKSILIAVGVEYQNRDYVLHPGDEVSFFPPVQGG